LRYAPTNSLGISFLLKTTTPPSPKPGEQSESVDFSSLDTSGSSSSDNSKSAGFFIEHNNNGIPGKKEGWKFGVQAALSL
jgi:hypothetical protein